MKSSFKGDFICLAGGHAVEGLSVKLIGNAVHRQ